MPQTDLIIHDEKDNVAVVVIDKTSKNQECTGWIMENDKTIKIKCIWCSFYYFTHYATIVDI